MIEFWKWLVNLITVTGIVGVTAFLLRDTLSKYFAKAVANRFEKQMEQFKADIRAKETERDQIHAFLASSRREYDSVLQAKRLEAAEILLRTRDALSQLSMLAEYMKMLKTEELFKRGDDAKITEFIKTLVEPFDVEEKLKALGKIDRTVTRLYLSEATLKSFNAYESIVLHAVMLMRLFSINLKDKGGLINQGTLSKTIIELLPDTKDNFEKFGESFAYYWTKYFYDEILQSLRNEISGLDGISRDSVERVAMDSHQAQMNIRASLAKSGLPDSLINAEVNPISK